MWKNFDPKVHLVHIQPRNSFLLRQSNNSTSLQPKRRRRRKTSGLCRLHVATKRTKRKKRSIFRLCFHLFPNPNRMLYAIAFTWHTLTSRRQPPAEWCTLSMTNAFAKRNGHWVFGFDVYMLVCSETYMQRTLAISFAHFMLFCLPIYGMRFVSLDVD